MSVWKGVSYDSKGKIVNCLFCRICELKEPAKIVNSNDKFVAFLTIAPVTKLHVLISPREHISNIYGLRDEKDAQLVEEMVKVSLLSFFLDLFDDCLVDCLLCGSLEKRL